MTRLSQCGALALLSLLCGPLSAQRVTIGLGGGVLIPTKHIREGRQFGVLQYDETRNAPLLAARVLVHVHGPFSLEALGALSSANHHTFVEDFTEPDLYTSGNAAYAGLRLHFAVFPMARTTPTASLGVGVARVRFKYALGPGDQRTQSSTGLSGSVGAVHRISRIASLRLSADLFSYNPDNPPPPDEPTFHATNPRQLDLLVTLGLEVGL